MRAAVTVWRHSGHQHARGEHRKRGQGRAQEREGTAARLSPSLAGGKVLFRTGWRKAVSWSAEGQHVTLPFLSSPLRTWFTFLYSVWLGSIDIDHSSTGKEYYVSRIVILPRHDGLDGDLALLRLSSPVTFTATILPVCLPNVSAQLTVPASCWVTGWGQKEEGTAKRAQTGSWSGPGGP